MSDFIIDLMDDEYVIPPKPYSSLDRSTAPPATELNQLNIMEPFSIYTLAKIDLSYNKEKTENGYIPYAVTFTYPDKATVSASVTNQKGRLVVKYVPLEQASQIDQRQKMVKDITTWINAVNKLVPMECRIDTGRIYFELTKKGRIHAHGIIYSQNKYICGFTELMALQWARISKGSMASMSKISASGKRDKAFDKCNNVKSWLEYISKEYNPEIKYL